MTLNLENSREAFLAVLTVVVAADGVGSLEERNYLFEKVKGLKAFEGCTQSEFNKLLGSVTSRVFEALPSEDGAITAAGVDQLVAAVKPLLGPDLANAVLDAVAGLSDADSATSSETALLQTLRQKLRA
jgi:hypothetical protein